MNTDFLIATKQNAFNGKGPLDAALEPVEHISDLSSISENYRYKGMTVTVLKTEDEKNVPIEYYLYNGIGDFNWKIKSIGPLNTYSMIKSSLPSDYRYYLVGLKVIIKKDETNDNKMTEYVVSSIDIKNKTVTWERCDNGSSTAPSITVEGTDIESAGV